MKDKNEMNDVGKAVDVVSAPVSNVYHRNLRERAEEYNGELLISDEIERKEPVGDEVW